MSDVSLCHQYPCSALIISELTPTTASLLAQLCADIGLPRGVFNVVHGTGLNTGQALVEHSKVSAVSFTGGTSTGALVGAAAAKSFKKLSLELGGKNPNIIFAGALLLSLFFLFSLCVAGVATALPPLRAWAPRGRTGGPAGRQ